MKTVISYGLSVVGTKVRVSQLPSIGYWLSAILLSASPSFAKVDLVTLPDRDAVEVTIYNSADMTLVRESRGLTLEKGTNRLQFSWVNTLIDPTSLELMSKVTGVDVEALSYPARTQNVGVWNLTSDKGGKAPMEITYLTSGLSWRAFYMGTLSPDEKTMKLEGYVRVENNSGEDYENAKTRLIVGQVHLLDEIAELARRQQPYGRPGGVPVGMAYGGSLRAKGAMMEMSADDEVVNMAPMASAKTIEKEGLSEYFLYTIEGTETLNNGWSKRLPSFGADQVPVENLYKYEEERYGNQVMRFLSFKNDKAHKLGVTPIPGGDMEVYRTVDKAAHLSYEGQSAFKYIPVDEDVELGLGSVGNVVVEPKIMKSCTTNFMFDAQGDVSGWDDVQTYKIEVKNTRDTDVRLELTRNTGTPHWDVEQDGKSATYEKVDLDTMKFTLTLEPRSKKEVWYTLTTHQGRRAE